MQSTRFVCRFENPKLRVVIFSRARASGDFTLITSSRFIARLLLGGRAGLETLSRKDVLFASEAVILHLSANASELRRIRQDGAMRTGNNKISSSVRIDFQFFPLIDFHSVQLRQRVSSVPRKGARISISPSTDHQIDLLIDYY